MSHIRGGGAGIFQIRFRAGKGPALPFPGSEPASAQIFKMFLGTFQPKSRKNHKMDIFVSNLPFEITEREISEAFAAHGAVSGVKMLFDKVSGRFRGIAFVSMEQPAEAEAAIAALNGADLGGRPMRVDRSRPREERFNGFGGGFNRGRGGGFRREGGFGARGDSREGGAPGGFKPRKNFGGGGFRGENFDGHSGRPFRPNRGGFKRRFGEGESGGGSEWDPRGGEETR